MRTCTYLLVLPILWTALLLSACDTGGSNEAESINGTWESIENNDTSVWLHIDLPRMDVYNNFGATDPDEPEYGCHERALQAELERLSGDRFVMSAENGARDTIKIYRQNDILHLDNGGEEARYGRSDDDVTSFELCA